MSLAALNDVRIIADHVGRAIPDLRFSAKSTELSPNPAERQTDQAAGRRGTQRQGNRAIKRGGSPAG
jgi:hypothetical protein